MIQEVDFFTNQECADLSAIVKSMQDKWVKEQLVTTLGGAIYVQPPNVYDKAKEALKTPLLSQRFE